MSELNVTQICQHHQTQRSHNRAKMLFTSCIKSNIQPKKSLTSLLLLLLLQVIVTFCAKNTQDLESVQSQFSFQSNFPLDGGQVAGSKRSSNSTSDKRFHSNVPFIPDKTRWRMKYIDEMSSGYTYLIHDKSLDRRLSNVVYTVKSIELVNTDFFSINTGNSKLDKQLEQSAAGFMVDDELCGRDLSDMLSIISELGVFTESKRSNNSSIRLDERHFRVAQVLDSFGRYQSGALTGRRIFEGSYTQCVGLKMLLGKEKLRARKTRYCVARLKTNRHLHPDLRSRVKPEHEGEALLDTAICIPETCHMKSFHANKQLLQSLVDGQFKLPKSMFIEENRELDSIFCSPDSDSQLGSLSTPGKLFIFVLLSWLTLALYATFRDKSKDNEQPNSTLQRVFECVDLEKSWQDFTCQNERVHSNARVNLNTMNSVKVLIGAFTVLGHAFLVTMASFIDPLRGFNNLETDPVVFTFLNGTLSTDSFYVISGILIVFVSMKKFKPVKIGVNKNAEASFLWKCLQIILTRYARLMPLLAIVFWFKKSIFSHIGSGPSWNYALNKETVDGSCQLMESWYSPLLFLSAFQPLSKQCLPQTWSISGDMMFILALAPLVILLTTRPKLAAFIAVVASLMSNFALLKGYNIIDSQVKADISQLRFHAFGEIFRSYSYLYTAPHFRVFSILIGALGGYALYHYEKSDGLKEWPSWFKGIATKMSLIFILAMIPLGATVPMLKSEALRDYNLHANIFENSMTIGKLIWAVTNTVLLLRMVTDWKDSFLMRNSAGVFWKSMVRLNYPLVLIHMDILIYDIQSQLQSGSYTKYRILAQFASTYLFCLLGSLILHLLIENPIDKLTRLLLRGERPFEVKAIRSSTDPNGKSASEKSKAD